MGPEWVRSGSGLYSKYYPEGCVAVKVLLGGGCVGVTYYYRGAYL